MFSSDKYEFNKIDCNAKPVSTLPAFGFAFNASAPQFASLFTPLLLPSTSPNPNITVPVINDTVSVGDGIKIQELVFIKSVIHYQ